LLRLTAQFVRASKKYVPAPTDEDQYPTEAQLPMAEGQ